MNKVILLGRATADIELRYTANKTPVATFSLAVRKDNETADFFEVVCWKNTAEFAAKYFGKGSQLIVVGRLQNRKFTTSKGEDRKVTEIVADELHFADTKKKESTTSVSPASYEVKAKDVTDDFLLLNDSDVPF